jgi:hypothetical protein
VSNDLSQHPEAVAERRRVVAIIRRLDEWQQSCGVDGPGQSLIAQVEGREPPVGCVRVPPRRDIPTCEC